VVKRVQIISFLLVIVLLLLGNPVQCQKHPEKGRFELTISTGYHHENFRWSIAGNSQGKDPNIYSELIWKNLRGAESGIGLKWNFWKALATRFNYSHAFILSGIVTDTDYQQDNRTYPSYFASFDSDRGSINNFCLSLSWEKIYLSRRFSLSPLFGYSMVFQSLYLLDHAGKYDKNLRSTYKTFWNGLQIGGQAEVSLTDRIKIIPSLQYHQLRYRAKGNWNLIEQFEHPVSYRHIANGYGIESSFKVNYALSSKWSLSAEAGYSYYKTGTGRDILYLSNGQESYTRFNGAIRKSSHFSGNINFHF
jgi:hypothetical protein